MKSIILLLSVIILFSGCGCASSEIDAAMELRQRLLLGNCSFTAEITADYGDELYQFQMDCNTDTTGTMSFTVTEPASIAGITGTINAEDANLTFDKTVLSFPPLAGGRLSPVSSPWIFINTLRSGYLSACGKQADNLFILADDSYGDNALHLEILTTTNTIPIQADIFWNQQQIITLNIRNFVIS